MIPAKYFTIVMLSSRGCGKYEDQRWLDERAEAIRDPSRFTSEQLTFLEVVPGSVHVGTDARDETCKIDSVSMDVDIAGKPEIERDAVDIRDRPEAGGRGYT